jgi:hypothetical protein
VHVDKAAAADEIQFPAAPNRSVIPGHIALAEVDLKLHAVLNSHARLMRACRARGRHRADRLRADARAEHVERVHRGLTPDCGHPDQLVRLRRAAPASTDHEAFRSATMATLRAIARSDRQSKPGADEKDVRTRLRQLWATERRVLDEGMINQMLRGKMEQASAATYGRRRSGEGGQ